MYPFGTPIVVMNNFPSTTGTPKDKTIKIKAKNLSGEYVGREVVLSDVRTEIVTRTPMMSGRNYHEHREIKKLAVAGGVLGSVSVTRSGEKGLLGRAKEVAVSVDDFRFTLDLDAVVEVRPAKQRSFADRADRTWYEESPDQFRAVQPIADGAPLTLSDLSAKFGPIREVAA